MWATNNSRLAAALMTLGHNPSAIERDPETRIAIYVFEQEYDQEERAWMHPVQWKRDHPDDPLTYIRKVASARDWIVNRVLHGNHNADLLINESSLFRTQNVNVACCLVAADFYLYKLNAGYFYFCRDAARWNIDNQPGAKWMLEYLAKFDELRHRIKNNIDIPLQTVNNPLNPTPT